MKKTYLPSLNLVKMKYLLSTFFLLLFSGGLFAQPSQQLPVPTSYQVQWQDLEYYMFIHFGPNTFTNKEWGTGTENPEVFNPVDLDCRQWARTAKLAGMKGIIITAKHHDGFCLWPSKYSTHTVAQSKWRDGKGDVLKELSDACKEYGLKFGVYLSPWDRNHPDYGTPAYNEVFVNMLKEIYTSYGPVFEQWFDGANGEGPNGKKQIYDWHLFNTTVRKLQPDCIIFSDVGPDARWVGNENGIAGKTNWSKLNVKGFEPGLKAPSQEVLNTGEANGAQWVPAECDVSIRPGWFYSPSTNDQVKSIADLTKIYYASVGRNANLLLNVPPDRRGLVAPEDSIRLMEFRKKIDENFADNLAVRARVMTSGDELKAGHALVDGSKKTWWSADKDTQKASITLELPTKASFNTVVLQEYIPSGQHISAFNIEVWDENSFREVASGSTIGNKRILEFPRQLSDKIRVNILDSQAAPVLAEIQLYNTNISLQ